jgi:putative sigma-54 modulation protein
MQEDSLDVTVSSRHVELTAALRSAAEERIGRLSRFLDGMDRAEVHLFEERNPRIADKKDVCEVTLEGHGHHVRTKVAAADPFSAVDAAAQKLEHQLHKLKTKLVDRSHPRRNGTKGVAVNGVEPDGTILELDEVEEAPTTIVRTKTLAAKPMTVDEAVMQLELLGHDFFLFTNAETGGASVIYRRRDGRLGLIEATG